MGEKEFNLLQEPWIRVMREDCRVEEVSLADALIHAHEYQGLAGELPTQDVAIMRLLLAVLHAVFERVDADGNETEIEDADDALDRWKTLWDTGHFPEVPLRTYFDAQKENFWLFHPTRPFWQIPEIPGNGIQSMPVEKLNGAISESGNKFRIFSERSGNLKEELTNAETARWFVCMNQYDDNAMKTGLGVALLGQFVAIVSVGKNLFETLMLNFVLLDHNGEPWESSQRASWENEISCDDAILKIAYPKDPVAILSYHSRYGKLIRYDGKLNSYKSPKIGICYEAISHTEQMAIWERSTDEEETLLCSLNGRQAWREFSTIFPNNETLKSNLVRWHTVLQKNKCLPQASVMRYGLVDVTYDKSQHSSVVDIKADSLSLNFNLLSELGTVYRRNIEEMITLCDKIARNVARLASELYLASGGDQKKKYESWNVAMEKYYFNIDIPFRQWLAGLDAEDSEDVREEKLNSWRRQSFRIALEMAEEMVYDAGKTAYIGRTIAIGEGDDGKIFQHFSTPMAMLRFENKMAKFGVMKKIDIIGGNDLENAKKLEKFVACKLQEFLNNPSDRAVRASLAQLRHGIGHWPGEIPTLWGEYLLEMPEELMGDGEPSSAEWAIYIALTMFALHQQGKDIKTNPMHRYGEGKRSNSLGDAAQGLLESEDDLERIARRFNLVALAPDMEALAYHLRGLVTLLRAKDIPLDYVRLASDLYFFQNPETANRVRLRWGRDFCRIVKENDKNEEKGQ